MTKQTECLICYRSTDINPETGHDVYCPYSDLGKTIQKAAEDPTIAAVACMALHYRRLWEGQTDTFWLHQVMAEFSELTKALADGDADAKGFQLMRVAAFCITWLRRIAEAQETPALPFRLLLDAGLAVQLRRLGDG